MQNWILLPKQLFLFTHEPQKVITQNKTYLYPDKMLSKVDLPAPEGPLDTFIMSHYRSVNDKSLPMIAQSSPDRKRPLTSLRIVLTSVN